MTGVSLQNRQVALTGRIPSPQAFQPQSLFDARAVAQTLPLPFTEPLPARSNCSHKQHFWRTGLRLRARPSLHKTMSPIQANRRLIALLHAEDDPGTALALRPLQHSPHELVPDSPAPGRRRHPKRNQLKIVTFMPRR